MPQEQDLLGLFSWLAVPRQGVPVVGWALQGQTDMGISLSSLQGHTEEHPCSPFRIFPLQPSHPYTDLGEVGMERATEGRWDSKLCFVFM